MVSMLDRARVIPDDMLFPAALAVDADGVIPGGHFDRLGGPVGKPAAAAAGEAPSVDGSAAAARGLPAAVREADRRHFGNEFERVAQIGNVTPNEWMRQAVGAPLSAAPLISAAEQALGQLK